MPWKIVKRESEYCVVKKADGKVVGCSATMAKAKKHLAALHANVDKEYKDIFLELAKTGADAIIQVNKEDDHYKIVAVSTAALKDSEDETFTVEAIDYDIALAEKSGEYPEFRVFHKKYLSIGKVTKMSRVGIFAIDEGRSYKDDFSLEVCEKMLSNNNGKWKVSRGFFVFEASGGCPDCGEGLVISNKHMLGGFRCPSCKSVHLRYKGVLEDVHFHKTKTFDITVTDIASVPFTGVAAFRDRSMLEDVMTKEELKEKLLDAGISEEAIDEKLKSVTNKELKEYEDIPNAIMKELSSDDDNDEDVFVLDDSVLKEFGSIVKKIVSAEVKGMLDGLTVEIADMDGFDIELKELPQFNKLTESVEELNEKVTSLLEKDDERLKEMLGEAPRGSRLRIRRLKAKHDNDDEDEDEEDEDEENIEEKEYGVILGADGKEVAGTMTEFITAGGK